MSDGNWMMGCVVLSHCDLCPTSHCSLKTVYCHCCKPREGEWLEGKRDWGTMREYWEGGWKDKCRGKKEAVRWDRTKCRVASSSFFFFFFLAKIRVSQKQKSSSVLLGKLFRTSPLLRKKCFSRMTFLTVWKTVKSKEEKREVLSQSERMRESKVRYFYYLLGVLSPFIFPLQSVVPPFFPPLLDLCFSISPYANKPSISWGGWITGRGKDGRKYQRYREEGEKTKRWKRKRGGEEKK